MPTKTTINIASRLELFVDHYLTDKLDNISHKLHTPHMASNNPPHPTERLAYETIIKDNDVYHRYGRLTPPNSYDGHPDEKTLHYRSTDGITWSDQTVVLENDKPRSHNFCPFLDSNPNVKADERFKALAGTHKDDRSHPADAPVQPEEDSGLFAYCSADGLSWKKMSAAKVLAEEAFSFDSQNVSFWSEVEECYVCYYRTWKDHEDFTDEERDAAPFKDFTKYRLRSISRVTSDDFINWSKPVAMNPNLPGEDLYTSLTQPYFRAPHIYIATPTRFMRDRGCSTDILFMSTRAGNTHYDRLFGEAFIRPGLSPERWGNRSNYAALNIVPASDTEISIYHICGYRYTLRTDGFISLNAGLNKGTVTTKPFTFSGDQLKLNYSTSAAGFLRVEIQDENSKPIPGFTLDDCPMLIGDKIEGAVSWNNNKSPGQLAGQTIKLKFELMECDLYSLRFS